MRKSHTFALFLSLSLGIFLSGVAVADGTETGKVKNIIVEGASIISIWLEGEGDFTADCAGGGRWTVSASDGLFKEKYAAILAAASSGKTITLFHHNAYGCGNWDSNRVYWVNTVY